MVVGHVCPRGKPRRPDVSHSRTLPAGSRDARDAVAATAAAIVDGMLGARLGTNYQVVSRIGAGGMGVVYLVEHVTLKKRFAAKVLSRELSGHPEAIRRFEVEARSASRLEHDNIVNVIDYGQDAGGTLFQVMELLKGETLQARIERGRLTLDEVVAVVIPVCHALGHAHAAGIVHRDVKPENVFLAQRGGHRPVVKVLDFGISKVRELGDNRITKQGELLGSPEYMSPEAARGDEVDSRADIYAVGVMLYELLCGKPPFRHESYLKVLQMHGAHAPTAPRTLSPDLSPELEALILRLLAKDPAERPQSMEELEQELVAALPGGAAAWREVPSLHTPPGLWISGGMQAVGGGSNPQGLGSVGLPGATPTGLASAAPPAGPEKTVSVRPWGDRGRLAILAVVLALAAVALTVFVLGRSDPAPAAEATSRPPRPARPAAAPAPAVMPAPAPTPAPAPAPPALPSEIALRLTSTPAGATATLGGRPLGRTPLDVRVPRATEAADLVLELRGHAVARRPLIVDRDVALDIPLTPLARIRPARPDRTPPPPDLEIKESR